MKKFLSLLLAVMMLLGCLHAAAETFPKLDNTAAWDYIGEWFGVSGLDVMGDPTVDYPELELRLYLNGLGDLYVDSNKKEIVGWYVENDMVFLARTIDKVPQADDIFALAYKNETGRLVVDLGYCAVICEQEGEEYLDATWPAFDAEDAKYFIGEWEAVTYISEGMELSADLVGSMVFILNDDGTAQCIEEGEEPYDLRWYSDYSVAYLGDNPMELVEITFDGNGNLYVEMDEETAIVMAPAGAEAAGAEAVGAEAVGAEGEPFFGVWTLESMMGMDAAFFGMSMQLTLNQDGTCSMSADGETDYNVWSVADGAAIVAGDAMTLTADGKLVMTADGADMVFVKGEGAASDPSFPADFDPDMSVEDDDDDEMSDEDLAMLLALLAQLDEEDTGVPEHLQPYVGTWHMVYIATGGLEGDLRTLGVTARLELNADGTGKLSGAADDSGSWYDDEGTVRFGQADSPLKLLDGGFLQYGSQLAGYMVFSQDETATWSPAPAAPVATAAPAAPAAPAGGRTFSSYEEYMGIKFVATTYTSFGNTLDAATLGAEYSVTFYANGSSNFVMGGVPMPGLTWGLKQIAMGLTQIDAFVINYGTDYNFIPTETGFDLDFFGTMMLHFVPAE